ncbi:hypothetical protein AB0C76_39425 [Kitasatospora sp. NPDC048722]|uniref:hypothetical protein n=1 Tax=Kitasatospora sp. NPDC048722 TaxID=3155639 RepID=UPI0033E95095
MTEKMINRYRHAVEPLLGPGEALLDVAKVVPVAGVGALGADPVPFGSALARIGAVAGGGGSMAAAFPTETALGKAGLLTVTDRRVAFVEAGPDLRKPGRLLWAAPRARVARAERRPRTQAMARFRLHFADGSSVAMMTMRRRTIESLAVHLGR